MAGGVGDRRPLKRGDVYIVHAPLPDRAAGTGTRTQHKWVVLLHGDDTFSESADVTVLVASTWKAPSDEVKAMDAVLAPYEVMVGRTVGFDHASVIDGRWPFTMLKSDIRRGTYKTTLPETQMEEISVAILEGLGLE